MELIRGNVKVEWVNIGEGICGDYDASNPEDIELLRFYVSIREGETEEWQDVEDASYCTNFPVNSDDTVKSKALKLIMKRIYRKVVTGGSIKKICEELSHISEKDFI